MSSTDTPPLKATHARAGFLPSAMSDTTPARPAPRRRGFFPPGGVPHPPPPRPAPATGGNRDMVYRRTAVTELAPVISPPRQDAAVIGERRTVVVTGHHLSHCLAA